MGKLSRRKFISNLIQIFAVIGLTPIIKASSKYENQPLPKSRIVRVTRPDAADGSGGKDNKNLNSTVIQEMVDEGIMSYTDTNTVEEAWRNIIPDSEKKVAIKINCELPNIYTKAKVVKAVTDGLILRGVPPSNIVIYDIRDRAFGYAGFEKNLSSGIKIGTIDELGGFSNFSYLGIPIRGLGRRFCKVLAGEGPYGCDYLINIPVLKALDGYSGVSISMKNHFGSIATCSKLHPTIHDSIAKLNAHKLIREKTRLILVDGIFASYKWVNGRDQKYIDHTNQLMFGSDPVAIDYLGWKTIEKLRKRHGLEPIEPKPLSIQKAALEYGIGNNDIQKINLIKI